MSKLRAAVVATITAAGMTLTACGGDDDNSTDTGSPSPTNTAPAASGTETRAETPSSEASAVVTADARRSLASCLASAADYETKDSEDEVTGPAASKLPGAARVAIDDGFGMTEVGPFDLYAYADDAQVEEALTLDDEDRLAIAGLEGLQPVQRYGTLLIVTSEPLEATADAALTTCVAEAALPQVDERTVFDPADLPRLTTELTEAKRKYLMDKGLPATPGDVDARNWRDLIFG